MQTNSYCTCGEPIDIESGEYQNNDVLQMTYCSFTCSSKATLEQMEKIIYDHDIEEILVELTEEDSKVFLSNIL